MAFKARRQHRYTQLIKAGFLPYEAREISHVPFNVPYMKSVISARRKILKQATTQKMTKANYQKMIKKQFPDPWELLRKASDAWKQKHPDYQSPSRKKKRNWPDFQKKLASTARRKKPTHRLRYLPEGGAELVPNE